MGQIRTAKRNGRVVVKATSAPSEARNVTSQIYALIDKQQMFLGHAATGVAARDV